MILAYYRLGRYEDAKKSMRRLLTFACKFRMDNPLVKFGSDVYQPNEPINLCYDTFGPAAGLIRGLFEYLYRADGLTLYPHIPTGITELHQKDPIRFGSKKLYLSAFGTGPITAIRVNGRVWPSFDKGSVFLPYDKTPAAARIAIFMGGAKPGRFSAAGPGRDRIPPQMIQSAVSGLEAKMPRLENFYRNMAKAGLIESYEARHARLVLQAIRASDMRKALLSSGKLPLLPEASRKAADQSYIDTAVRLFDGLEAVLKSYEKSSDPIQRKIYRIYTREETN